MRAQQYQTQLCGWSKLITPVENMFWACYIIVSILLILSFDNFYKNICSWSEAVDGGDFYFQFLDFLMPQAERCYVIMYNVQCWSPVPERSVPSWDMCFMEMFTQSVNNRAAAAPLNWMWAELCKLSGQRELQDLSHLICFFGKCITNINGSKTSNDLLNNIV